MISELKDEEILDFLMTSEFEENYKPEEYKYLLSKWRYFYRIIHGRLEVSKTDFEGEVRKLQEEVESLQLQLNKTKTELVIKTEEVEKVKNKKLSWKERLSGKINI